MISNDLRDRLREGHLDYRRILEQPAGDNVFANAKTKTVFEEKKPPNQVEGVQSALEELDPRKQKHILSWMDKLLDDTAPKTAASTFLRDTKK